MLNVLVCQQAGNVYGCLNEPEKPEDQFNADKNRKKAYCGGYQQQQIFWNVIGNRKIHNV